MCHRRRQIAVGLAVLVVVGLTWANNAPRLHAEGAIDLFEGEDGDDESSSQEDGDSDRASDNSESNAESDDGALTLTEEEPESTSGDSKEDSGDFAIESLQSEGGAADSSGSRIPGRVHGRITLEFERRGNAIIVPARVEGRSVYFLFDTGATYTTLTPSFAREIGAMPGDDAPSTLTQTAAGPRRTRYGVMSRLSLGGSRHNGVTFSVCEPCGKMRGSRHIVGLLGLNVLRRYQTSINDSEGVVELIPHSDHDNRWADIEPWLKVRPDGHRTVESQGRVQHRYRAHVINRAPRSIRNLTLEIECQRADGTEPITTESRRVGIRDEIQMEAQTRTPCRRANWGVADATW